ncbi:MULTISPECIES: type II toxin-antitoxin system Phd/YefM family antitoxin [unclassified Herbaspirillum]|uniref:type II toxin-antitoxin system Phd/YefM family antitoxin n=1 Tax=unclassified Herbaspirillum TaxID=2624150 RepID=UPI001152BBFA|nr:MULTISPECIES: type II toxin-antitoxin system Phd/YefM family antitoxin [unclassified Herbaspirillum]MBB5390647.1 antitoxin YefM [Herbaspirillum sp. SJZ102]TQK08867.1 antitoxin YefM [Herbaspirillum sp. SJZ130]TQK14446.1 antitoxin YefM [Herbaspirillum sp. SJZ106]TWC66537.1 antitoxin YefM [Herbaspirillum sp. SJZ099]
MYSFSAKQLASRLSELIELADIDEVVITRDSGENLVIVKESVWRAMQDTAHLFATDINSDRLLRSLQQLRADLLSEPEVE